MRTCAVDGMPGRGIDKCAQELNSLALAAERQRTRTPAIPLICIGNPAARAGQRTLGIIGFAPLVSRFQSNLRFSTLNWPNYATAAKKRTHGATITATSHRGQQSKREALCSALR